MTKTSKSDPIFCLKSVTLIVVWDLTLKEQNDLSNKKMIPRIACEHNAKDLVVADSHEVVCKRCGVVVGIDNTQEMESESIVNLYQELETGCKPVKLECARRTHEHRADSSYFSNACSKLGLKRNVSHDAWRFYVKISKNTSYTRAEIACFALFTACKIYSVPKSEEDIQSAVEMTFSAKRIPTMLRVLSLMKVKAEELGIVCHDSSKYYLNLYLAKAQDALGYSVDFSIIKRTAYLHFQILQGNPESRARKAVQIATSGIVIRT